MCDTADQGIEVYGLVGVAESVQVAGRVDNVTRTADAAIIRGIPARVCTLIGLAVEVERILDTPVGSDKSRWDRGGDRRRHGPFFGWLGGWQESAGMEVAAYSISIIQNQKTSWLWEESSHYKETTRGIHLRRGACKDRLTAARHPLLLLEAIGASKRKVTRSLARPISARVSNAFALLDTTM